MQRRKQLTVRQRQDAKVEWRATNLRLRQKHLHSSQMKFEDYIDYVAGYCIKDKSYPIMPAYNKGPYMVIPLDELTTAGKK